MKKRLFNLLLLPFICVTTLFANPVKLDHSLAQLISDHDTFRPGQTAWLSILISPEKGWHTYWENPGDSGLATKLSWQLPDQIKIGAPRYPFPERLDYQGLTNYGFKNDLFILIPITLSDDIKPNTLHPISVDVEWLICKEECIIQNATLTTSLYVLPNQTQYSIYATDIQNKVKQLPKPYERDVTFASSDKVITFEIPYQNASTELKSAYFYPLTNGLIKHALSPITKFLDDSLLLEYFRDFEAPKTVESGVLVVESNEGIKKAFHIDAENIDPELQPNNQKPFLVILFFAFLGGLILNVMPCVFPVLSIKVLQLLDQKKDPKQSVFYVIGVVATFLLFGLILEVFKYSGQLVGWGFQLQSPIFIVILTYLFLLVGFNLIGKFELPTFIYKLPGLTDKHQASLSDSPFGQFLTGVFAVIVATPCTAPFMAVALGVSLTLAWYLSLAIFVALGLGMAFLFLIFAYFPKTIAWLPKPGKWMERVKQCLAIPMFLSVLWLIWILEQQVSLFIFSISLVLMAIAISVLFLRQSKQTQFWDFVLLLLVLLSLLGPTFNAAPKSVELDSIDSYLSAGSPVFVDVTAAWCITCKVNEKTVLKTAEMQAFFTKHNITFLEFDWTNKNENITSYLKQFKRNGVPLYVFYVEGKDPVVLPQLLTIDSVKDSLLKQMEKK